MSYERLELTDFVDKWDAAKVKHLEDGIVANEEAIERYHNDSVVEMQADWAQSDETAKDYVKNRTHYKETKTYSIANNFETTYNEKHYESGNIARYFHPDAFPCNLSMESKESTSLKVFVNGEPIKVIDYRGDSSWGRWYLENNLVISYYYYEPKGGSSESQFSWSVSPDKNFEGADGQTFNLTVTIDGVTYVPIDEKYMPKSVLEWQQPVDWNCNDINDPTYIKNRTHYDYWGQGNKIYDYSDFENEGTLPYTFQVTKEGNGWLGGHGFMYNDCLFNGNSNWEKIGNEYDDDLEISKVKYKCQQTQIRHGNEETLTINAISYSQYISEKGEWVRFVTIDCEYEGYQGIQLYEAEMRSKTIDKRFLADFSVEKDWNVNNLTDPRYIENRTHYSYLGQGKSLQFKEYDTNIYDDYNYLPYTQIVQSDLTEADCPGYWLGKESGYWINLGDPLSPRWSYLIDAYSDWKKISEEENNVTVYQHEAEFDFNSYSYILTVAVSPIANSSNEYNVELRNAIFSGEAHFEVCAAKRMYKTLDAEYLPDGLPNDIDWNENNETSCSYIRNRPCYEKEIEYKTIFQKTITENPYHEDEDLLYGTHQYRIICNGETTDATPTVQTNEGHEYYYYTILTPSVEVQTQRYQGERGYTIFTTQGDFTAPYEITIQEIIPAELKQLDDKFIPDNIARTDNITVTSVCEKQGEVDLVWADIGEKVVPEQEVLAKKTYYSNVRERGTKLKKDVVYNVEITDLEYGGIYPIIWTEETKTTYSLTNGLTLSVDQYSYNTYADFTFSFTKNNGETSIEARIYEPSWIDYKLLNENCIPESIARTSQIEALNWEKLGEYYQPSAVLVGVKPFWSDEYLGEILTSLPTTMKGLEGTSLQDGDVITIELEVFTDQAEMFGTYTATVANNEMSISEYGIIIDITYTPETNEYYIRERNGVELSEHGSIKIVRKEIHEFYPLKDEYIPNTIARAPKATLDYVTEAPTAEQYNALLDVLKEAGILV